GVLHRQRRKSSRTTTQPRPIAKRQIPRQRTQRPPVPRYVMQHQKQHVLAPTQRKQMRAQRHLARKIKTSLRRSRQRSRKLPFAHPTYRKPNTRRSNSQNLLPRYPKPLREDRAQALVALNNIPKRSFHPTHIQLAHNTPQPPAPPPPNPARRQPNPPGGSCRARPPPPAAPKTTADAAHTTAAPRQDAQPHATQPALPPPPPTAQPAPLPSALRTDCGSKPQHQGSNGCG